MAQLDFRSVVLQPTAVCNLNCAYCYLPDRKHGTTMSVTVARAVAASLTNLPSQILVLWHGGEPLATGFSHFRSLVSEFRSLRDVGAVRHSLQTNATLLTDEWCSFLRDEGFQIGVSIDGPTPLNASRVTWAGKPAYEATMRGIARLRENDLRFAVIAVVNPRNVTDPEAFYNFFVDLGCSSVNINVEEREGLNRASPSVRSDTVRTFWERLFEAWRANPVLRVREFDHALGWMQAVTGLAPAAPPIRDMWPTIAVNGDVVVLSPELMAAEPAERSQFVVGNILRDNLETIVARGLDAPYVLQFWDGLNECRRTCSYFSYCGGGHASNKYFEHGTTAATVTDHCVNTKQAVMNAVMSGLGMSMMEGT